MVAYSFKRRFIDPILAGTKDQTIRAPRQGASLHAYPGAKMQLYFGMRTSSCALILRTICVDHLSVTLRWSPIVEVIVTGEKLLVAEMDAFARRDGFTDFGDMERFWSEVHPGIPVFGGEIMRWKAPSVLAEMGADVS